MTVAHFAMRMSGRTAMRDEGGQFLPLRRMGLRFQAVTEPICNIHNAVRA